MSELLHIRGTGITLHSKVAN